MIPKQLQVGLSPDTTLKLFLVVTKGLHITKFCWIKPIHNLLVPYFAILYRVFKKVWFWVSLVAQWLGVRLPLQGTRVRALVREDPTCRGADGPVRRCCWACALEPASHSCWAREPQLLKPARLEPGSTTGEATAVRGPCTAMRSGPPLASTWESPRAAGRTQHSQK